VVVAIVTSLIRMPRPHRHLMLCSSFNVQRATLIHMQRSEMYQKYKAKSVRDYQSCKLDKPFVSQHERERARLGGDISSSGTDTRKAVDLFLCPEFCPPQQVSILTFFIAFCVLTKPSPPGAFPFQSTFSLFFRLDHLLFFQF